MYDRSMSCHSSLAPLRAKALISTLVSIVISMMIGCQPAFAAESARGGAPRRSVTAEH
jgi:hypothetical protein